MAPWIARFRRVIAGCLNAVALAASLGVLPCAGQAETLNPGGSATSQAVPLALHRASYKITLLSATGTKSPTSARGRLMYEFTGSARDGYSQVFRQITEMQPAEGETRLSDMRSATFEDGDGKTFSFYVKTVADEAGADVVEGRAAKKTNDLLAIQLSKPKSQLIDVDNEVLFPTAHLGRIIAAAKAGQQILGVRVFDGSDDGKKVFDTTTIIGRPMTGRPADPDSAHSASMDLMQRWPVSISYFEEGHKDQGPAYTLSFELYENGVSRALRFDYGDFVLGGELTNLELLTPGQAPRSERPLRIADTFAPLPATPEKRPVRHAACGGRRDHPRPTALRGERCREQGPHRRK